MTAVTNPTDQGFGVPISRPRSALVDNLRLNRTQAILVGFEHPRIVALGNTVVPVPTRYLGRLVFGDPAADVVEGREAVYL